MTEDNTFTGETYSDLTERFDGAVADTLARVLDDSVTCVVIETWLVEEKDIETVANADRVAEVKISRGTEKAWRWWQPDADGWLPKSCATVVESNGPIESPQASLSEVVE